MNELTSAERRTLRARAHPLHPTVMIGEPGLSPTVLAEIERSFQHHELIKVRVLGVDRDARDALLSAICERTGAQPVQHIGRILVMYRAKPEPPQPTKVSRRPSRPINLRAKARKSNPHITPPRGRGNRRKPRPR
jgi:RNA-binding protein